MLANVAIAQSLPLEELGADLDGDLIPDRLGEIVTVEVTAVTRPFELPNDTLRLFVADADAGMRVQSPDRSIVGWIEPGDRLRVRGVIAQYQGANTIEPIEVAKLGEHPVPRPVEISVEDALSERYEGRLVRVVGTLINAQNVEINDGTDSIRVRARRLFIDNDEFMSRYRSGRPAEVVGIADQYDPSDPHNGGYRIEIIDQDAITLRPYLAPYFWIGSGLMLLMGIFLYGRRSAYILQSKIDERTGQLEEINQQLEVSDRQRRQLFADISHELRTPLTIVRGEAEMALRGNNKPADEYREALSRVVDQANQIARLVDDLLFVARAEEGKARMDRRAFAVSDVLKGICNDFRAAAARKTIGIEEIYALEEIVVVGDQGRLRQVFAILLDNAIRYSHDHGTVTVSLEKRGEHAEIKIKDRGIGLTAEDAKHVFHRYYRGSSAVQHASRGTGLGLPVAKAIVEAHGGTISLSGETGQGAEATVLLLYEAGLRSVK